MISTKVFQINLKTLALVLIVFTIFTVSLTENLQIADGFSSASTAGMKYDLSPGESGITEWTIYNSNQTTHIQFVAKNPGSEFFTFEENVVLEPNESKTFEFIVSIPADHSDNIQYRVDLLAKEIKPPTEGGAASILIAYEMVARPMINIGDNPVYTAPPAPVIVEDPKPAVQAEISDDAFSSVEEKPLETIKEKLERINEANTPAEVKVDDTFEESFEEEAVKDYVPEPMGDSEPITIQEEKIECDFIAWLLSLFGLGKC